MLQLALAAVFFVGLHFLISGSRLRDTLVFILGEPAFRAEFSLLSLFGLWWLVHAYRAAPYLETWGQPGWFKPIAAFFMLFAFLLIVAGLTTRNPVAAGGGQYLDRDELAHGILRITRHPVLWGISLWALLHLFANGDAAALVLFGSLLLLTLGGAHSLDAKRLRLYGENWERFLLVTSNVPFAAIRQERNVLRLGEIGWWRPVLAIVLYLAMMHFHAKLFGVSPLF
jgi:uncharacterized membrane protein